MKIKRLNESIDPSIDLTICYDDLDVCFPGRQRDVDVFDADKERTISYDYEPDEGSVIEHIIDYLVEEDDSFYEMSEEDLDKYIEDNLEDLFNKYYEKLKEHFRDSAAEEAVDKIDVDEYDYDRRDWDAMPGGHDYYESFGGSYKKGDRVYLIDTDETGTVTKDFDWENEDQVAVEIDGMGTMKYVLSTQLRDLRESEEPITFGARAKKLNEWAPDMGECPSCGDTSFDTKKGKCTKCSYRESLNESENYKVKFFQVFEAPKSPKENGKMIGQRGTLDDANAFGKERVGEGNYIIKAVCDDGKTRPIDNDTKASDFRMVESIEVATIADYIVDHYDFDDIDDKYSCINSIRDSFKGQETISEEELEQFIGAHNGKDKVNESFNDGWTQRFSGMNVFTNGDYQIKSVILGSGEDGWELGTWNDRGTYRRIDAFKDIDKAKQKAYDLKYPLGESVQEDAYTAQRYLDSELPDMLDHIISLIPNLREVEIRNIISASRKFYTLLEGIAARHSDVVRESLDESLFEDVEVETKAGPDEGPEYGLASVLNQAIQDEFKTIDMYNSIAVTAKEEGFEDIVAVIDEINTEENKHVGQLQELLKTVSPNAEAIDAGEIEGSEQIVGESINNSNSSPNNINEGDADMTERAKEIYNSFKEIEKELNGDGEAITAVIDKLYDDNREDPDYKIAWTKWADGE